MRSFIFNFVTYLRLLLYGLSFNYQTRGPDRPAIAIYINVLACQISPRARGLERRETHRLRCAISLYIYYNNFSNIYKIYIFYWFLIFAVGDLIFVRRGGGKFLYFNPTNYSKKLNRLRVAISLPKKVKALFFYLLKYGISDDRPLD